MTPVYDQDGITLYQGDCHTVMPLLRLGTDWTLFTDPPYTMRNAAEVKDMLRMLNATPRNYLVLTNPHSGFMTPAYSVQDQSLAIVGAVERPLKAIKRLIEQTSGLIVDPYCGTGTTLIACQQLGRKAIGIEIDPARITTCLERLQIHQNTRR